MRIGIITDLHWGIRNNNSFFQLEQEKFYNNTFFPYIDTNNIKHVFILGDIVDNRKVISITTINNIHKFFNKFQERDIQVTCLKGNHDIVFKNTNDITSIVPLAKGFSCIDIVDDTKVKTFDDVDIGFINWINPYNHDIMVDWLKTVPSNIIVGHFEINGFQMVNGIYCKTGMEPSIFNKFDLVLSGHFHIRSRISNVQYIGNPLQTNWGDYNHDKGFAVLDTTDLNIQFINNPHHIYKIISYDDDMDINSFNYSFYESSIVRLVTNNIIVNKIKFDTFLDNLSNVSESVEIISEDIDTTMNDSIEDLTPDSTYSVFKQYIDEVSPKELDKSILYNMLVEIYEETIEHGKVLW